MSKKTEPNTGSKLALLLFGSVFMGFILGIVWALLYTEGGYDLFNNVNTYLSAFPVTPFSRFEIIADSFLKYGKFIISIWFMAYLPVGALFVFVICFIKGFSLGFAISALISVKGLSGAVLSLCLILPQNLVFILALVFVGFKSVSASFGTEKARDTKRRAPKRNAEHIGIEYFITLIAGMAAVFVVSLYEAYAVPFFWNINF